MSGTVSQEFIILFLNLGVGMGIGLFFDCYRGFQRLIRPGQFLIQITDMLFWIGCAVFAFGTFFYVNGGEVRYYTFLTILAGSGVYFRFFSAYLRSPLFKAIFQLCCFFRFVCYLLAMLFRVMLFPVRLVLLLPGFCFVVILGFVRLICLPEKIFLHWSIVRLKERLRSYRNRKPPHPPASPA